MSHLICYHHLAVSFPSKDLEESYPTGQLGWERSYYLLLELAGDNNVTTTSPAGREVGHRTWSVIEYGNDTRIMESAVRRAEFCEGGNMSLYGQRYTSPESYIRRIRCVLANAVHFNDVRKYGFSLAAKLKLNHPQPRADDLASLNLHVKPEQANGNPYWPLSPLDNPLHAALLMLYGRSIDTRPAFRVIEADGPRFKQDARNFFGRPLKQGRLKLSHGQSDDVAA